MYLYICIFDSDCVVLILMTLLSSIILCQNYKNLLNVENKQKTSSLSASVLRLMCQASSWMMLPTVYSSSHTARKARPQVRNTTAHIHTSSFHINKLTSTTSPQMLWRNWSLCCRRTKFPCSSPSPDWFRPLGSRGTWQVSMRCSCWWRASAPPSICPAWCLPTTRPWHTSRSKSSQPLGRHLWGTCCFWHRWLQLVSVYKHL